jgi:hypothetical protein
MLFYLIGPLPVNGSSLVSGMSWKEPYIALGVVAAWGLWGAIYFKRRSATLGKPALVSKAPAGAASG